VPIFGDIGGVYDQEIGAAKRSGYSTKKRLLQLWTSLETERSSWTSHWKDLADYILPRRVRFNTTERNKGDKRNQKIINNTATLAARTLRSGMMAGVTSPARPWFRLTVYNPAMAEIESVKWWLHDVTRLMNTVMLRSNLYNSLPIMYGDLGVFGTSALSILEDSDKVMRTYVPPLGSYVISNNERGLVDCFAREFEMTVRQVVNKFGRTNKKSGTIIWDNISPNVRNLYMNDTFEAPINVKHFILPNDDYDPGALESRYKKFKACYFEAGQSPDKFLEETGFDEFPMLCPRWDVLGEDAYGTSPGMDALGDVKSLQVLERRKAQAVEKTVNPPMTGPSSLKNQKASLIAGDITYIDVREGQQGFKPAHDMNFPVKDVMLDIQEHQNRIQRAFYEDLFLMLTLTDRREITAREIEERHQEKLLMLGPVLERLNDECLDPMIDRIFSIMLRSGLIPPAPPQLSGENLKVEYLSIMAQAQKLVSSGSIERFATFVRTAGEIYPPIFDKVDMDQTVDEYGDMMGVPPRMIRSDDAVAAIRDERKKMQRAEAQAQNAERLAKAGKALGTTPAGGDTLLQRMAGAVQEQEVAQ
jgi:hypothetical protein